MRPHSPSAQPSLQGRVIVITRPAGTGSAMACQVRRRGGMPLLLPGLALRGVDDVPAAARSLAAALDGDVLVFTSPAAVRFAARLAPLNTRASVLAVGQGTARVLRQHGVQAPLAPAQQQNSEGLLAHPAVADLRGKQVTLIGAPGGRGVLRDELAALAGRFDEIHVYRRVAPRWRRHQLDAVCALSPHARVLLSSAEALENLRTGLPADAFTRLREAVAVVSSERLAQAARAAGFARVVPANSALAADLLDAAAR